MSAAKETAQKIVAIAKEYGWDLNVRGSILTIYKDGIRTKEDFVRADMAVLPREDGDFSMETFEIN